MTHFMGLGNNSRVHNLTEHALNPTVDSRLEYLKVVSLVTGIKLAYINVWKMFTSDCWGGRTGAPFYAAFIYARTSTVPFGSIPNSGRGLRCVAARGKSCNNVVRAYVHR